MGTKVTFNAAFFDTVLRSPGVQKLTRDAAGRALSAAKSSAPVDSGAYRDGIHIEEHEAKYRTVVRVVGSDPKTLLVEAKTGNLARSLKAAKSK